VIAWLAGATLADEKSKAAEERDRRAKAAVAVAKSAAAVKESMADTIPSPREVTPKDYRTGHKESLAEQAVLVVYVKCDGPKVDGAVTCFVNTDTFGPVTGPAVVVGYPSGDRLLIDKTLPCPPDQSQLKDAVKEAALKIGGKQERMPALAPAPLNTQINAKLCPCSPGACGCKGDCPAKCPAKTSVGHTHTCANGHTWDHSVTSSHSCPTCGLQQYVQDAKAKPVTAGAVKTVAQPKVFVGYTKTCNNGVCTLVPVYR